jgi:ABC-type branched-subunit amino acid transport system permease subunit
MLAMNLSLITRSAVLLALVICLSHFMPTWFVFLLIIAAAKGIVALGVITAMRGGLVSFGQGLFFAGGAYTAGLMAKYWGISDFLAQSILGTAMGLLLALIVGPLLSSYRGIFFATLTLALSMIAYGGLNKATGLGGSDGMTVPAPTFFGFNPEGSTQTWLTFVGTAIACALVWVYCDRVFKSRRGLMSLALRENELRVDYLGASVAAITRANLRSAGALGGLGGAISAMALVNINPEFAFWTTSGEFVFVAVLAGVHSIGAAFVASFLLEIVKSFSNQYMANAWQFVLGLFLFLVILFLPEGLGSLTRRRRKSLGISNGAAASSASVSSATNSSAPTSTGSS